MFMATELSVAGEHLKNGKWLRGSNRVNTRDFAGRIKVVLG